MPIAAPRLLCAALLALAQAARADDSARAAVHEALSLELPVTRTETALPETADRDGRGGHNSGDEKGEGRRLRDERRDQGEQKERNRDGEHEGREHEGREHDGRDHEARDHGELGDHGEVGEHGSGERTVDGEHGERGGSGEHGHDKGHDGPD